MKKTATLFSVLLMCSCVAAPSANDLAMMEASRICWETVKPTTQTTEAGQQKQEAKMSECVNEKYVLLLPAYMQQENARNQVAIASMQASSAQMQAASQSMMSHYSRCTNFNGIVSCTGR